MAFRRRHRSSHLSMATHVSFISRPCGLSRAVSSTSLSRNAPAAAAAHQARVAAPNRPFQPVARPAWPLLRCTQLKRTHPWPRCGQTLAGGAGAE